MSYDISATAAPPSPYYMKLRNNFLSSLPHDIGGDEQAYGRIPIDPSKSKQDLLAWEQQCHSLFSVLASEKVFSTDELRRSIEALTPTQYEKWSYYEKWTAAMVTLLLENNVITNQELQNTLFGIASQNSHDTDDMTPIFQTGDYVRVKQFLTDIQWRRPHLRTPGYVYGVAGIIERVCGRHGDPSFLAFGLEAPKAQLYRVRFRQQDIWPEQNDHKDVVEVEIYEHWLEPATTSKGHSFEAEILFDHSSGNDCGHTHHSHGHQHDGREEHIHDERTLVESRAVQREGPGGPGKEIFKSLYKLLVQKEVVSESEVRVMSETLETAGQKLLGATLVAKAWTDSEFETRLLADVSSAAAELGISTSNPNAPTVLTVVKNTPEVHNLVVCTLCSCYPSGMLGIAPSWYKSREYRARPVREPREVLKEFGVLIGSNKSIRVHDSTADHRYLVLPERPSGTDGWSEASLRELITRDSMIGVSVLAQP